ncbi:hypothetical protein WMY93_000936 [Mugilogobius chulae]|uniref:Uncharacterized protein n=1 Tax=Mugilogobius chulae TaxID=88201 RepID=A0AAW0Q2D6_9GOBI
MSSKRDFFFFFFSSSSPPSSPPPPSSSSSSSSSSSFFSFSFSSSSSSSSSSFLFLFFLLPSSSSSYSSSGESAEPAHAQDQRKPTGTHDLDETNDDPATTMNGDVSEDPDAVSDLHLRKPFTLRADGDDAEAEPCTFTPKPLPGEDTVLVCERMVLLAQRLNSLQVLLARHSSQVELLQAGQSKSKRPARQCSSALLEQENQRNIEQQKRDLANLQKMQAQQREEQQRWTRSERNRGSRWRFWRRRELKLKEERSELETQRDGYQRDLERLREAIKSLEKDKEKHEQEKKKLDKLKRHMSMANPALNQVIPTKLEGLSGKKKLKPKQSHKRTSSAANIDVREVVLPNQGKEGGSLRAHRTNSPRRINKTGSPLFQTSWTFTEHKTFPSVSSHRRGSSEAPPPAPPPFPKDILDPLYPKEIFL